jgi:hypothetical protein
MSASLAVQLCRIIAPERLSDRFLSSGVLTASESRNLGDQIFLAYVFEVMQPWLPSAHLLPALNATLEAEYPKLVDPANTSSIDDKFELLLRAVNQTLNQVSEEGETDWIGNLNGIIMVLSGEELHFSQTGQCPAYLLQNNRIRQVTDDPSAQQDPHPLKTFSNLASGQLKDGDQLLVANHELYREISLDALRRILNTASPFQSAQAISKELKREKNPAVSTLILKFTGTAPAQPEPESVILEEEMQSGLKKFGKRLAPFLDKAKDMGQKAGSAALATGKQAQGVLADKVAPKVGEIAQKGKDFLTKEDEPKASPDTTQPVAEPAQAVEPAQEAPAERPVVEIIPSKKHGEKVHLQAIAEAAEARITQEPEEDFSSIIPDSERTIETKHTPESKVLHTIKHHGTNILATIGPVVKKLMSKAIVWLRVPGNRKKAALGGGVLILLITIWIGISAARKPSASSDNQSNASILSEVTKLKDTIQTEIDSQQTIQASKDTETALTKLASLKDPNSSQQSQADALWTSIAAESDKLTTATRLANSTASYQFTGEARGFISGLPYFYGWNASSNNLFRTGIGEPSQTQATVALADTNDTILSVARSSEADTAGYTLTKQGKVLRIVQTGTQTLLRSIAPSSGDFAAGDAIASYAGNVYILDGKAGLLWKYANTGTSYNKGVSIIDINKFDIKKSVSVAVDGSFYLLKSDGTLSKYTSGKEDGSFLVQNVPALAQKLVQPTAVVTSETYANVYVLDAGATSNPWSTARVLIFNKDGNYVGQYTFPKEFTKVRAFDINPKDKKLWVLNDQTIYEFAL